MTLRAKCGCRAHAETGAGARVCAEALHVMRASIACLCRTQRLDTGDLTVKVRWEEDKIEWLNLTLKVLVVTIDAQWEGRGM